MYRICQQVENLWTKKQWQDKICTIYVQWERGIFCRQITATYQAKNSVINQELDYSEMKVYFIKLYND